MMHKLRTLNPGKTFIEAPTAGNAGNSATCKSCAHCPWMAMNSLAGLAQVLKSSANEIHIDPALGLRARLPIDRMLAFTTALKNGQPTARLVPNIGAAWLSSVRARCVRGHCRTGGNPAAKLARVMPTCLLTGLRESDEWLRARRHASCQLV